MVNTDKTEDRFIRMEAKLDKIISKVDDYRKYYWSILLIVLIGVCGFIWVITQIV
jgi:hypothetical protein